MVIDTLLIYIIDMFLRKKAFKQTNNLLCLFSRQSQFVSILAPPIPVCTIFILYIYDLALPLWIAQNYIFHLRVLLSLSFCVITKMFTPAKKNFF